VSFCFEAFVSGYQIRVHTQLVSIIKLLYNTYYYVLYITSYSLYEYCTEYEVFVMAQTQCIYTVQHENNNTKHREGKGKGREKRREKEHADRKGKR
jgi:hypothetical protein